MFGANRRGIVTGTSAQPFSIVSFQIRVQCGYVSLTKHETLFEVIFQGLIFKIIFKKKEILICINAV